MYEVYKNNTIQGVEDAAGITSTAHDGESRLGVDFFTGEELETADKVISRRLVCDRCGCPPKHKDDLIKQGSWMVCKGCVDG